MLYPDSSPYSLICANVMYYHSLSHHQILSPADCWLPAPGLKLTGGTWVDLTDCSSSRRSNAKPTFQTCDTIQEIYQSICCSIFTLTLTRSTCPQASPLRSLKPAPRPRPQDIVTDALPLLQLNTPQQVLRYEHRRRRPPRAASPIRPANPSASPVPPIPLDATFTHGGPYSNLRKSLGLDGSPYWTGAGA